MSRWEPRAGVSSRHSACAQGDRWLGATQPQLCHQSQCTTALGMGQKTRWFRVPRPGRTPSWPAWMPIPTQFGSSLTSQASTSHAHLRTTLQKALRKLEASTFPREEVSACFSPGRLLFICFFSPLSSEVPQQGAQGTRSPWPQLGVSAASRRDRGPPPRADGISHKTSPARPPEFIVTGTLLQNADCSDKWEFSNENLPHWKISN